MEEECLDIGYKAAEAEAHKARIEWYYRRALDRSEGSRLKGAANPQDHPAVLPGLPLGLTGGWAGEWAPDGTIVETAAQDELRVSPCPKPQRVPGWKSVCPDNCGHATHRLGPREDLQKSVVVLRHHAAAR